MPTELEEPRTDYDHSHDDPEEFEGGPVKTFLEHLEDLRWVLIKTLSAVGVAFVVCLLAAPQVVEVLEYPLKQAKFKPPKGARYVSVQFGTNRLTTIRITPEQQQAFGFGTNQNVSVQLVPVMINGSNIVVGLQPDAASTNQTRRLGMTLINLGPVGGFVVATKVALYGGMLAASPFIFYFIAAFVFPALKMKEKKYVYRGLLFGLGLFLVGVGFCYFVLMPIALTASVQFSEWMGFTANEWRAEDYISFVCKFMLGMGLGFELPVIILILVKIGVLSYSSLAKGRRYMIVISFILGAVLTTPEVVTQVLMAIPLIALYEITIWIAWYWERQERKRAMAAGEESPA
jgi:sec-independent protein translocase protein TatC